MIRYIEGTKLVDEQNHDITPGGGGGTPLKEANGDVPLDGVAFSRLD